MSEQETGAAIADAGTETKSAWQQAVEQAGAEMSGTETQQPPEDAGAAAERQPEAKPDAKAEEPKKDEKPADAPAGIDWSKVDPSIKAAYDAAEEKAKRFHSMVAPLQRQNNDLLHKARRASEPEKPADGKTPDLTSLLESEKFKKARADFPDVFEPFIEALGVTAASQKTIETKVQSLSEERQAEAERKTNDFIFGTHPDFNQVGRSPAFHDWAKNHHESWVREAFALNGDGVVDPVKAVEVVSRFKLERTPATKPAPSNTPPAPIDPKRQRQLDNASAPRTNTPARASNEPPAPGTPGHWEWAVQKAKKEMAAGL